MLSYPNPTWNLWAGNQRENSKPNGKTHLGIVEKSLGMVQTLNFLRKPLKGLPNSGPPRKFSRAPGITIEAYWFRLAESCSCQHRNFQVFPGNYLGKLKIIQTTENHSGKLGIYKANWVLFRKTGKHSDKLGIIQANWELFRKLGTIQEN
jgi:hypothetical protein